MPFPAATLRGPWAAPRVVSFLDGAVMPIRLGVVGRSGWPSVTSLWFLRDGDELLLATQASSPLVRALGHSGRCGFEIAGCDPPYHGVRGRAHAEVGEDRELALLRRLLERYLGGCDGPLARRLLARETPEALIRLRPTELRSWDYRARMAPDAAGTLDA